jgi:hypothetical protein
MGVDLVHLTCCATFDIFCDEVPHARPPVVRGNCSDGVQNSGVSSRCRIVKQGKYPPLKIVVSHNDEGVALPPKVARAMFNVELGAPSFENWLIFRNTLQMDYIGFNVGIQVVILNTVNLNEVIVGF